jgi:hypothetical protein
MPRSQRLRPKYGCALPSRGGAIHSTSSYVTEASVWFLVIMYSHYWTNFILESGNAMLAAFGSLSSDSTKRKAQFSCGYNARFIGECSVPGKPELSSPHKTDNIGRYKDPYNLTPLPRSLVMSLLLLHSNSPFPYCRVSAPLRSLLMHAGSPSLIVACLCHLPPCWLNTFHIASRYMLY